MTKSELFIQVLYTVRLAVHSEQEDFQKFINTIEGIDTLIEQAKVLGKGESLPGFSTTKKSK